LATRRATFLIRSIEPTDVPPNFCTMSAMRTEKSGRFYRRAACSGRWMARALALLLVCASALAADPAYRLDLGISMSSGTLRVEPVVAGPAGKTLRYEMSVRREGKGGSSATSQAGSVRLDGTGKGQFAYNSLSVGPGDRYVISVKVYEGDRLVASEQAVEPKQ
jgi:hypothetical protein